MGGGWYFLGTDIDPDTWTENFFDFQSVQGLI